MRADFLEENRDLITRFGRGMAKGKVWSFAPANQDAAIDAALRVAPDTGSKEEVTSFIQILQLDRALPAGVLRHRGGRDLGPGWDDFQKLLLEGSTGSPDDPLTFTEPIDVNEIVDNSMVPDIFDFDKAEVEGRTR